MLYLTSETTGDAPKPILRDDPEQSKLFIKKASEIGVDGQFIRRHRVWPASQKTARAAFNQISPPGRRHPRLERVMNLRQV